MGTIYTDLSSLSNKEIGLLLRPIKSDDNAAIAKVIRSVLEEYGVNQPGTVYTDKATDELYYHFEEEHAAYWIAELKGEIVGGCGLFPTPGLPDGCIELVKLYVLNQARGNGIGATLMNLSIDFARELGYKQVYLETMPELDEAVGLYKKLGFRMINERLGASGHFACKIWMVKDL